VNTALTPSPIQALIFDMDGLLVDSEQLGYLTMLALLEQHGCVREWEPEVVGRLFGRRLSEIMPVLVEICGITAPVDELVAGFEELRMVAMRGNLLAFPGAAELIDYGQSVGLRLALATSGRRGYVDAVLTEIGLTGRFAIEVTGEDVARGKPAPDVYLLAAERLGVAPARCVVLEDAPSGIASAVAAGMRAVAVANAHTRDAEFAVAPETVLPDLHAVIPWLQDQGIGGSPQSVRDRA
jgi:beta-phosphoglucomutase-like phosphatase (HAD superfamily)